MMLCLCARADCLTRVLNFCCIMRQDLVLGGGCRRRCCLRCSTFEVFSFWLFKVHLHLFSFSLSLILPVCVLSELFLYISSFPRIPLQIPSPLSSCHFHPQLCFRFGKRITSGCRRRFSWWTSEWALEEADVHSHMCVGRSIHAEGINHIWIEQIAKQGQRKNTNTWTHRCRFYLCSRGVGFVFAHVCVTVTVARCAVGAMKGCWCWSFHFHGNHSHL